MAKTPLAGRSQNSDDADDAECKFEVLESFDFSHEFFRCTRGNMAPV